jgi:hypothetical protein
MYTIRFRFGCVFNYFYFVRLHNHYFPRSSSGMDCRNPGTMDGFELTIHGTGYPLPGWYDELEHNLTK